MLTTQLDRGELRHFDDLLDAMNGFMEWVNQERIKKSGMQLHHAQEVLGLIDDLQVNLARVKGDFLNLENYLKGP